MKTASCHIVIGQQGLKLKRESDEFIIIIFFESALTFEIRVKHLYKLDNRIFTVIDRFYFLSKTSQIFFDLHPDFSHMEDEKGNKLHLCKKYFKMMFFLYKQSLVLIVIHFNRFLCYESLCKENLKSKICGF